MKELLKQALDTLTESREALILMRKQAQQYGEAWAAAHVASYRSLTSGSTEEKFKLLAISDERIRLVHESVVKDYTAIAALQAAIDAPEPEPVAQWQKFHPARTAGQWINTDEFDAKWWSEKSKGWSIRALYTRPASAKPLTEQQIDAAVAPLYKTADAQRMGRADDIATARAIEAALGIKSEGGAA